MLTLLNTAALNTANTLNINPEILLDYVDSINWVVMDIVNVMNIDLTNEIIRTILF